MEFNLKGKTALVTGASRGIGKSIATMLHAEGCRVALNSRNADDLLKVAESLPGAVTIQADVTQPKQAQQMISDVVEAFGHLDILVCNVGSGSSVPPGNENYQEWQRIFAINLWSATNTIEAARDALSKNRGAIVCISSICGSEVVPDAPITYSAAKAALHAYVRGISRPLGLEGIRINAIASGNILFDGSVWSRKLKDDSNAVQAMLKRDVALASLGSPRDVAELVIYLVSSRAGFATGSVWTLDGGQVHS